MSSSCAPASIEQQGAPLDLYDHPANRFVAGFIGSPAMNFVDAVVREDGMSLRLALPHDPVLTIARPQPPGTAVVAGLRPEYLILAAPGDPNALTLPLALVEQTGGMTYAVTDSDPALTITATLRRDIGTSRQITVTIDAGRIHLFNPATGLAL